MRMILLTLGACNPDVGDTGGVPGTKDTDWEHIPGDTAAVDTADTADTADTSETGDTGDTHDTADTNDTEPYTPPDCSNLPAIPTTYDESGKVGSSEDFRFDAEGYVVHVDDRGSLTRVNREGDDKEVILPGLTGIAGIAFMADGYLAIANVTGGSVDRVGMDGSRETIVSGLIYPNGLDVGMDGWIYTADNATGKVHRINPEDGEDQIIAEGLLGPNGVTFSPDQQTVYIGSFGGGIVYGIDKRDDDSWKASIYAGLPGLVEAHQDDCVDLAVDDECYMQSGKGPGVCLDEDGDTEGECTLTVDEAACASLSEGASCTTTRLGVTYESMCATNRGGLLVCPSADAARVEACSSGDPKCSLDGVEGSCQANFEGVSVCVTTDEKRSMYTVGCEDKAEGDACTVENPASPDKGTCTVQGPNLRCIPWWQAVSSSGGGGFDGINVDECGNVYIAEYVTGKVWRWTESGDEPEQIVDFSASWIPNMHFGVDAGGFEKDTLYVMNRDKGTLFGLDLGMYGKDEAYPAE